MLLKSLLLIATFCGSNIQLGAGKYHQQEQQEQQYHEFTMRIEQLILNATQQALLVTKDVYDKLRNELSPQLLQHSPALDIMRNYTAAVDAALAANSNYTQRRRLLQQFKANSWQLEQLRQQIDPLQPQFELQLISRDFISERRNVTAFDNLYLHFMQQFANITQQLWDNMSEQFVEENEELLELLDEISNEHELREKDKLYDEFIETYLFKRHESGGDGIGDGMGNGNMEDAVAGNKNLM